MTERMPTPEGEGEDVKNLQEEGPELSEEEAAEFEDEAKYPPEDEPEEVEHEEVRDGEL